MVAVDVVADVVDLFEVEIDLLEFLDVAVVIAVVVVIVAAGVRFAVVAVGF